ncbi:MAG: FHA domain-containing protein [Acidobacteria bacterium]|nr:FHA domain-containing protein [Acidobacteriota bacterium]
MLLDSEVKDLGKEGKFVPHDIKLKIQWGKFSTDSDKDLRKLEHELHASAIDHINDRLYHTYAPINIEIQTDYFTEGVRLLGSFGRFSEHGEEEAEVNVTIPNFGAERPAENGKISVILNEKEVEENLKTFIATFLENGKERSRTLDFTSNRRISVGRSKENGLDINDGSISKIHASLVLGQQKELLVADTGSTNGTFVGGHRISYGKAFPIEEGQAVKFGTVEVKIRRVGKLNSGPKEAEVQPTVASAGIVGSDDLNLAQTEAFIPDAAEYTEPKNESTNVKGVSDEKQFDNTIAEESELPVIAESQEEDEPRVDLDGTQDWEI